MSIRQVHRQVTEEHTEIQLHESDDGPHAYVEIVLCDGSEFPQWESPAYISLTPAEATAFADAVLSSAQRVSDRLPHGNC